MSLALVAAAGAAALLHGPRAGADADRKPGEWFGSPVSGTRYHVQVDDATGGKSLVAPDGRRFDSIAAIIEDESSALSPLERLLAPDLLAMSAEASRADELVDVTFILRRQPMHEAGTGARARTGPALQAEMSRVRGILDRIAPLRTYPGGRGRQVGDVREEEGLLLTAEEKQTIASARKNVRELLAKMRREVMAEATRLVKDDQAALAAFVRSLPGAIDFGGSVTLNAMSARDPARALREIADRFPEVLRIDPVTKGDAALDVAVQSVGAGSYWAGGYDGSTSTLIAICDCGVDASHPAFSGGVVTNAAVYHTTASTATGYGDSSGSTDDLQGHGTRVAGIACSNDTTYKGIAYGGLILNAKAGFTTTGGGASMYWSDGRLAQDWAFTNGATALSLSYYGGVGTSTNGSNEMSLFLDAACFSLAIPCAISAGNSGSGASTTGYPGDAFNILAVGSITDAGTTSHSDDSLAAASSRGPTSDGRQKPELVGPGINITSTAFNWESGTSFNNLSGSSNVPPLAAGALALLEDYAAATYPEGLKALLLTTANNQSPYGATPDNSWGFGVLDMAAAYTNRASVYEGALTSTGDRAVYLRCGSLATGGRVTLAWNRQVTVNGSNIPTTYFGIQDLDLYVYDLATGAQVGSSNHTVDPVEQVAVTSAVTSPVIKVYRVASSFTTSYTTEPFAVAAEATTSTYQVTPPVLACTMPTFTNAVQGVADTTVGVQITNTGGITAPAPVVTITLPSSYTLVSGASPQTLPDIAPGANATVTWTIRSPSGPGGTYPVVVNATSAAFGESFTGSATKNQLIDGDLPTGSIAIANGSPATTSTSVTLNLAATDASTAVTQMRLRNAGDASWEPWVPFAASMPRTLTSGEATKTIEVEYMDEAANVSATYSDSIWYDLTPPVGEMAIQAGVDYTSSASVNLTSNASDNVSGIADARFSNDGVSYGAWTPYAFSMPWTMTSGEGTKTVHAQYRDGAGFLSTPVSDTIIVDASPPSGTINISNGAAWTALRGVTLNLSASDPFSGMGEMRFSDDLIVWTQWQTYGATAGWLLLPGDGTKTVYAQFKDAAGNIATPVSDTIGLDTTGPTGSVLVQGGADFATSTSVMLGLSAADANNGVAQMRFSNDQITWSPYQAYATSASWTLTPGDGTKTVSVQFKDGVGNASFFFTDTIKVDSTPPTGSMKILADVAAINTANVSLNLTYSDAVAGVSDVRMSNDGTTWSPWTAAGPIVPWMMTAGEGLKTVTVQYRDAAGNESATASDTIIVDSIAPTGSFVILSDIAYVMPWQTITADTTSSDGPIGSGVVDFRSSADGGATWSPWVPIVNGQAVVPRPAAGRDSVITIQGQFRDVAGNASASATDATYLADDRAASVTLASAFSGTLGLNKDSDTVRIALLAGDKLTLKLKTKSLVKKADVRVDIDVFGPDHTKLITDRYPATGKKLGVTKYLAPATGEYWIVLRAAGTKADTGITYTLSISNAALKGSRAKKGVAPFSGAAVPPGATVEFDAPDGFMLNGTLTGPLTPETQPTLRAPDGSTATVGVVPGKKGAQKLVAFKLAGGTGKYVLTIPSTGPVNYVLSLSPGKLAKLNETQQ